MGITKKIRNASEGKDLGILNLKQYQSRKVTHINVCKELKALSDNNDNFPMGALVYFAVGKDAHKSSTLKVGYDKIDVKKAITILKWLTMYAKKMGNPSLKKDGGVVHAVTRFYEQVSTKTKDFKTALDAVPSGFVYENKKNKFKETAALLKCDKESVKAMSNN